MNQQGKLEVPFGAAVLLGGATLVASVLVFLLGVYVGKGMIESRLAEDQRVVRLPAPTPGPSPKGGDDATFWDRLAEGKPALTQGPPAAPATPLETPVRVVPPAAAAAARQATPTTAPKPAAPTAAPKPETAAPRPEPTARPEAGSKPEIMTGGFQVQVNAMADRRRADALVQDLQTLGYKAYLSPAKKGSDTLYRVRVSGLGTEEAAKSAVARLREQGYPTAFLVREGG